MIEFATVVISVVAVIVSTWSYIDTRKTYNKIKRGIDEDD